MLVQVQNDLNLFLKAIRIKNNSMNPKMWDESSLTKSAFDQVYDLYLPFLVYEDQKIMGGFLLLEQDFSYWNSIDNQDSCFYIHKLFILPEFNGQGYTTKIMNWIKIYAKQHCKTYLRLDCRQNNPKLNSLYEKEAFLIKRSMISPLSGPMNLREYKIK